MMAVRNKLIIELIPRLRRFARAVSGDIAIGDHAVKSAITVALHQPFAFKDKETLFRSMLMDIFRELRTKGDPIVPRSVAVNAAIDSSNVADRLMSLTLPERAALVLATTETLSYRSIAEILETAEPGVRGYLTQAREKLCVGKVEQPDFGANGESHARATAP